MILKSIVLTNQTTSLDTYQMKRLNIFYYARKQWDKLYISATKKVKHIKHLDKMYLYEMQKRWRYSYDKRNIL